MRYPIVLHTDDGTRYGVTVPDFPGCFSAGDSIEEAIESVKEAIDLHAEGMVEEGQDLPFPEFITEHQKNPDYAGGIWAVVEVDLSRFDGKAEKINITLPRRLLVRVDEFVQAHHLNRSKFLAMAAQQAMTHGLKT